ncbi:protease IV [Bacillus sp. JCM 19047]|nr:protease IV [Bacillus sp. JCM 19047]
MSSYNVSELLDNIGIEEQVYKSGPYKDILSPTREPLEEEDEIIQAIVDEYYDEFVDVIAQGRDMQKIVYVNLGMAVFIQADRRWKKD